MAVRLRPSAVLELRSSAQDLEPLHAACQRSQKRSVRRSALCSASARHPSLRPCFSCRLPQKPLHALLCVSTTQPCVPPPSSKRPACGSSLLGRADTRCLALTKRARCRQSSGGRAAAARHSGRATGDALRRAPLPHGAARLGRCGRAPPRPAGAGRTVHHAMHAGPCGNPACMPGSMSPRLHGRRRSCAKYALRRAPLHPPLDMGCENERARGPQGRLRAAVLHTAARRLAAAFAAWRALSDASKCAAVALRCAVRLSVPKSLMLLAGDLGSRHQFACRLRGAVARHARRAPRKSHGMCGHKCTGAARVQIRKAQDMPGELLLKPRSGQAASGSAVRSPKTRIPTRTACMAGSAPRRPHGGRQRRAVRARLARWPCGRRQPPRGACAARCCGARWRAPPRGGWRRRWAPGGRRRRRGGARAGRCTPCCRGTDRSPRVYFCALLSLAGFFQSHGRGVWCVRQPIGNRSNRLLMGTVKAKLQASQHRPAEVHLTCIIQCGRAWRGRRRQARARQAAALGAWQQAVAVARARTHKVRRNGVPGHQLYDRAISSRSVAVPAQPHVQSLPCLSVQLSLA